MLFASVQGAIGAEKLLCAAGIANKLIPVPRHLSSDCGFCVRIDRADSAHVEELLLDARLTMEEIVAL